MTKLNPPETAPKDKQILIDVGMPWLVLGIFNPIDEKWVYADAQCGICMTSDNMESEHWYFESVYVRRIRGWLPIPEKVVMHEIII